ncbi:hypothetical protein LTR08_006615 [Meristemomyces frigidus]|nr:hypothetical protein LTR08_006615 [Meristemomyces frigidus]
MVSFLELVLILAAAAPSHGLSQTYCSSENTGSDYAAVFNIYQSNGACLGQCRQNYAFAVVQYQNCWCTNFVPADQQSVSNCNQNCPGYPADKCGNEDEGLFGYIELNIQPSGTAGAAASTQASSTLAVAVSSEPVSTTSSPSPTSTTSESSSTATPTTTSDSPTPPTSAVVSITSTFVPVVVPILYGAINNFGNTNTNFDFAAANKLYTINNELENSNHINIDPNANLE